MIAYKKKKRKQVTNTVKRRASQASCLYTKMRRARTEIAPGNIGHAEIEDGIQVGHITTLFRDSSTQGDQEKPSFQKTSAQNKKKGLQMFTQAARKCEQ